MRIDKTHYELRLATTDDDLRLAQNLRYEVFIAELGGDGPLVDHDARLERDHLDGFFDHLLLLDHHRDGNPCVGVYRLMRQEQAEVAGQFYCDDEYDLSKLRSSGLNLLELGRSCLHPAYRRGAGLVQLWGGLAAYVETHKVDLLFGVASFHGTDIETLSVPLSFLHHRHLAPQDIRVKARDPYFQTMDLVDPHGLDRVNASKTIPALIKGYLRMGGFVGEGAFVDYRFNTTDICLILDVKNVSQKHLALYQNRQVL